ncbi:MAG: GC-type dockerin domain-anchored protein, partial [Phycisphaerales bacterium]
DVTLNMPMEVLGGNDQLIMLGPVVNNSTIILNPNLAVFNAQLVFGADTSITGNGQIVMQVATNPNDAQLAASAGFTGTIGAGQAVTGAGQINGDIVLNGSITATDPMFDMLVNDTLSGPGTLVAGSGARLLFSSADISGVTLESTGDGIVGPLNGLTTVSNVTIAGNAGIAGSNTRMGLLGDITNNGTLTLNFTDQVFNAILDFDSTATINGTGDIRMVTTSDFNDAQILTSDAFVGTFSAGQSIAGSGLINGTFVNNGTIDGDDALRALRLSGSFTGSGALFSSGGALTLESVDITDHVLGTSAGGIITASQGTSSLTDVINNGDLGLNGNNTRLNINGSFTNNGNVLVNVTDTVFNAVLGVNTDSTIDGTGTVVLETSGSLGDARIDADDGINATFGSGQAISGSGQIFGDVTVEGSLDPAGDLREINAQSGTLAVTGTTIFDLGGLANTEFDRITTGANQIISLGGSIEVNLDDGYSPMFGDEWEIIGGASSTVINGSYDSYSLPAAPISLAYRVFIESDRVYVRLTCAADFNGDAMNNFFDISTFIDLFNNGDPRADLTAPFGALNFFDIATYIAIYNAGCN